MALSPTTFDAVTVWLVVVVLSVGTFVIRLSFIRFFAVLDDVPGGVENALRFIPPAVLAALAVPTFVLVDGEPFLSPANGQLFAGGVAALVAWRTERILATIAAGMVALWGFGIVAEG